jgi:hypothetical protein
MLKKFLIVMGVLFTGLVGSCTVLGLSAALVGASTDAPNNAEVAVAMTRDLSKHWNVADLKPHFVREALHQVNFVAAQQAFNGLKPLGALKTVESTQQTEWHYSKTFGHGTIKTATVLVTAEFENGRAELTLKLRNEGDVMKLLHVDVQSIGKPSERA